MISKQAPTTDGLGTGLVQQVVTKSKPLKTITVMLIT